MFFVGSADEIIIGNIKLTPGLFKLRRNFICILLGLNLHLSGLLGNLSAMLVSTSQKESFIAKRAMPARQDIGRHGRIGMADMRHIIYIVNRSCNIEFF